MSARPPAADRLANPGAVLTRSDLAELGYEHRAVDAIFGACPVEVWEGYSRPLIRVSDFLEWCARSTYLWIEHGRREGLTAEWRTVSIGQASPPGRPHPCLP